MKIELEDTDIERIAQRVSELIKPYLLVDKPSDERLLTVKELSSLIGYSTFWIYNNKKKLNPVYINRKPLFKLSDINKIINNNKPIDKPTVNELLPLQTRKFKQQR